MLILVFYLTQYLENTIISTCNQHKKLSVRCFTFFSYTNSSKMSVYLNYQHISAHFSPVSSASVAKA